MPLHAAFFHLEGPLVSGHSSGEVISILFKATQAWAQMAAAWLQEFKKMPLRISRQMLLDQWNEAIAFVSSTMDARLAGGQADAGAVLLQ